MSKPYIIMTSELLISWSSLEEKFKKIFSVSPSETSYLYEKTKLIFKGLASEESVGYDYRVLLKRNLYEELYINLDTSLLRWIEKHREKFKFILISQIKNYRSLFREHLQLFDKIFSSYEYNKHFTDKLFLKTIFSYAYYETQNPSLINILTSFEIIKNRFKEIDYNVRVYLIDAFNEEKTLKKIKIKTERDIENMLS